MRTIIVGDVHGCYDELLELLKRAQFDKNADRLILVGDLINKGPKSFEVLEFARNGGFEFVLGNHEITLMKILKDTSSEYAAAKPQLLELARKLLGESFDWLGWLASKPLFIDDPNFTIVHAGVVPEYSLEQTPAEVIAFVRTWDGKGQDMKSLSLPAWYDLYESNKLIVYGHWAMEGLKVRDNTIGLDSGCCYGGELSAVILPERKIIQVAAKRAYQSLRVQPSPLN